MGTRNLILNRNKYAFHSDSSVGKIVGKSSTTLTIAAGSTASVAFNHDYAAYPQIIGWCQIDNDANRIPIRDTASYGDAEYFKIVEVVSWSNFDQYGFFGQNDTASQVVLTLNFWLYFI